MTAPNSYAAPPGGLPPQTQIMTDRALFTTAYAVIPKGVQRDIVTSLLPGWVKTRFWVLARPLTGFAETFSWSIAEVAPGGGSQKPEIDPDAQAVLIVANGQITITVAGASHGMEPGGYAYLAPGTSWTIAHAGDGPATIHWVRKRYQPGPGLEHPVSFVTRDQDHPPVAMPGTDAWSTTRFVDPSDLRHDMHVNIVSFQPGGSIPFAETHVMEHGLYVLEGKAVYRLNGDWVEVEAGDFLWLRAFCPQACVAAGPGPFRYLLYKDVNRHMPLTLPGT